MDGNTLKIMNILEIRKSVKNVILLCIKKDQSIKKVDNLISTYRVIAETVGIDA